MFASVKQKHKASSREQIAIKQIKDGVVELPNQEYRVILGVSAVNFELKSEEEQDAIIDTYESFLNSIGFPLQILIRTREIDMDKYLEGLASRLNGEEEVVYKAQLANYDEFIRSLITNNKILTRLFYVVIPLSGLDVRDFEIVREQLMLRLDIVSKGLSRLGMQTHQLGSLEVLDLFYSFYSPEQSKVQPLTEQAIKLVHSAITTTTRSNTRSNTKFGSVFGGRGEASNLDGADALDDSYSELPEFEEIEMIIKESSS